MNNRKPGVFESWTHAALFALAIALIYCLGMIIFLTLWS